MAAFNFAASGISETGQSGSIHRGIYRRNALGWTLAKHSFIGATGDQQLSILATVTLPSGLMCNFGLIGFMKYYCCIVITKLDHTK